MDRKITLTEKQARLLLVALQELADNRSNCGCNDAIPKELDLFTEDEIRAIVMAQYDEGDAPEDPEDVDNPMDTTFINWVAEEIKKQLPA